MNKLKYTVKTFLNEKDYNNLITILEDKKETESAYIRKAIQNKLKEDLQAYNLFCYFTS